MTRNLKALGLALLAAFAMSAVAASGAQALKLTTSGPAILTGEQVGKHIFKPALGEITCEVAKFNGTVTGSAETEVTIRPTYENCHMKFGESVLPATVDMTHCDYWFTGGVEVDAHRFKEGRSALECANDQTERPHIKVYKSAMHTEANRRCEFTVTPFNRANDKVGNEFHNVTVEGARKDVLITSKVEGIKVHRTFGGLFECGASEQTSTYTGETTMKAYEDNGVHLLSESPTIYEYTDGAQLDLTVSK